MALSKKNPAQISQVIYIQFLSLYQFVYRSGLSVRILLRQSMRVRQSALSQGELGAASVRYHSVNAEYLGILTFWNRNKKQGQLPTIRRPGGPKATLCLNCYLSTPVNSNDLRNRSDHVFHIMDSRMLREGVCLVCLCPYPIKRDMLFQNTKNH